MCLWWQNYGGGGGRGGPNGRSSSFKQRNANYSRAQKRRGKLNRGLSSKASREKEETTYLQKLKVW